MKGIVLKLAVSVLLAACICWIGCGSDKPTGSDDNVSNTDFVASESFSFEVEVASHTKLRLEGINGNVTITGLPGADSVIITGEKRVGSESIQDAEAHMQDLEVSVTPVAHEVCVKTIQPDETHGRSYVVDYDITLPQNLWVVVGNVNGNVTVDSNNRFVSVGNVNGRVVLNEIFGGVFVSLINGDIQAEVTLPADEAFDTIDMATANGDVDLDIPESTSARFMASVLNGTISISDLALKDPVSTATSLTGTFGDGQGVIALSLGNGDLRVSGF